MQIRRFRPEERELYLELAEAFYHSPAVLHPVPRSYLENTFNELMRSDVYVDILLLATDEDVPMGYMMLSKTFSPEAGGLCVWIEELSLKEEFRGQGAGTQAFRWVEEHYPHASRFRLEVEPDNEKAIRLYTRLGYGELPYMQMVKEKNM